jgi:hypothetical protein
VGVQERLESTTPGRIAISVFVAVTLAALIVWNLPGSQLKSDLLPAAKPYLIGAGLDQDWSIFAPDPRRQVLEFEARLTYADGVTTTWRIPSLDRVIGAYRTYRWRKWVEHVRADATSELWRPAAIFVARHHRRDGKLPLRVTLVRRWYDVLPPGHGGGHPPWNEYVFYTLAITPSVLRGATS